MKKNNKIRGTIELQRNGHGFLIAENDSKSRFFVHKKNLGKSLNNDTVIAELIPDEKGPGLQGVVQGVEVRSKTEFSGVLDINETKKLAFVRTSGNKMPVDIFIPFEKVDMSNKGNVVVAKITGWKEKDKSPVGIITNVLGEDGSHETEMGNIMFKHGICYDFPKEVDEEANSIPIEIPEKEILSRRDMRDVLTITIDPESAKDFDDALSFQIKDNGNYEVGVHIADVAHYIKFGSALDKEAYSRATSVYLVDRCIPMLPERLSNGICSLRPNEDKLAFSVIFEIDSNGDVVKHNFKKTVINSDMRLTYEEAQEIIDNGFVESWDAGNNQKMGVDVRNAVERLNKIARKLRARRFKDGAVSFNRREPQFVLDEKGKPTEVFFHESHEAHQLIEEFMLLANRYVATYVHGLTKPYVYRTHDLPSEERLSELSKFVENFGYSFSVSDNIEKTKDSLNSLLKEAKDTNESGMIETLAIRSMSKATYSTKIIGHYGLGFRHYSHFTSPIRRYPDLIAHRLLWDYINHRNGNVSKLQDWCEHCSEMENKAAKAQRESIKYKQCEFLLDKVGQRFQGIISSVPEFGVFVEILENGCDTMISKNWLASQFLYIDPEKYCVNDFNNGNTYRLGDEVTIEISRVSVDNKQIDAIMVFN